ncbi:hypothetical protein R6Q59_016484 [Mikania micrantha]
MASLHMNEDDKQGYERGRHQLASESQMQYKLHVKEFVRLLAPLITCPGLLADISSYVINQIFGPLSTINGPDKASQRTGRAPTILVLLPTRELAMHDEITNRRLEETKLKPSLTILVRINLQVWKDEGTRKPTVN